MLRILVNDAGALTDITATGTLIDLAAGISTAITFANVVLSETSPQAARDFRGMIRRCLENPDMWDAERMRPHVDKSVCALRLILPETKGDGQNDGNV